MLKYLNSLFPFLCWSARLPSRGQRLYIDPSNYDDPEEALKNFAKELDHKLIKLDKNIGGGEKKKVVSF